MEQADLVSLNLKNSFGKPGDEIYVFEVGFADNISGVAFAKSENPPYQVGDTVERQATGVDRDGNTKFKVSKPRAGGGSWNNSRSYTPKPSSGGSQQKPSYDSKGQTIGMAIKAAVDLYINQSCDISDMHSYDENIQIIAQKIIQVSENLQNGKNIQ